MKEIAIVGGGLAGAHAAALLALEGLRPVLYERRSGPGDKVCGEFLSADAQACLAATGFDLAALGGAPVSALRVAAGARTVEAQLPFTALGISRRRLDEALLGHAARLGAVVHRGVVVRELAEGRLETSVGEARPAAIVLASGKHEVRGARRAAQERTNLIGFKTYFRLQPESAAALAGAVELIFFEGGYAGLQLVEDGCANLCLLVGRDAFAASGQTWPALLERLLREPHLARRLDGATEALERPLSIANLPFGHLVSPSPDDWVYRIGDQAAVIDSFTGDGMAIALRSAEIAALALACGATPAQHHARLKKTLARPVGLATWLRRRTEAWPGPGPALAALALWPSLLSAFAAWTRAPPATAPVRA